MYPVTLSWPGTILAKGGGNNWYNITIDEACGIESLPVAWQGR